MSNYSCLHSHSCSCSRPVPAPALSPLPSLSPLSSPPLLAPCSQTPAPCSPLLAPSLLQPHQPNHFDHHTCPSQTQPHPPLTPLQLFLLASLPSALLISQGKREKKLENVNTQDLNTKDAKPLFQRLHCHKLVVLHTCIGN